MMAETVTVTMVTAQGTEEMAKVELPKRWTTLRFHQKQHELWTCQKRFIGVQAGRGSGKTELSKRRLVLWLPVPKPWPDPQYFYGAPTQDQAERIAWRDLKALVPKKWVLNIYEAPPRIVTVFGSTLWVLGMDKPQRVTGVQWDGCVIDESSDIKPGTFDTIVYPALTHRTGWAWRIGVPRRQGIGAAEFKAFSEKGISGEDPDIAAFNWPSADILPPESLEYARRNMDIKDFREQFEASWETAGGGIFHAFDSEYNVRPCTYYRDRALVIGSDFNVDPMAWVIGHRYPNRMEWVDEIFTRNTNTQATLDVLYGRYKDHRGGFEFYGDATGRARKSSATQSDYLQILNDERFKTLGRTVHYRQDNPPVQDRFAACNAMFCNAAGERRMFIDPEVKNLIRDVENRYYKPGTTEPKDGGDLGHATDAMGYPVHYLWPIRLVESGIPTVIVTGGGGRW